MTFSLCEASKIKCGVICWSLLHQLRDKKYFASISVASLNLKLRNFVSALVSYKNTVGCCEEKATNLFAHANWMLLGLTKQMYGEERREKETGQI